MFPLVTVSATVITLAISKGTPTSFILMNGSGDTTVLAEKLTLFPARLCLILPSFPFILSVIVLRGCPDLCLAGGILVILLSKKVVIWYCSKSHKSSMITSGAPALRFSHSLWLDLMISESLCVKSSSLLSPESRVIDGLTVTLGTSNKDNTAHSGLHVLGFIPIFFISSSFIATSLSLTSIELSLFFPSMNVVGFSSFIFSIVSLQCGHFFASLAFFALMTGLSSFCFSSLKVNFPHLGQKLLMHNSIKGTYLIWNTGLASSMLPGCPGHSLTLFPHVLHLTPGSIAPSLKSIRPPSTGNPSISYNSGVTILAILIFFTCSGLNKLNLSAFTCFLKYIPFILLLKFIL